MKKNNHENQSGIGRVIAAFVSACVIVTAFFGLYILFGAIDQDMIDCKTGAILAFILLAFMAMAAVVANIVGEDSE